MPNTKVNMASVGKKAEEQTRSNHQPFFLTPKGVAQWSIKWVEHHEVSNLILNRDKTLDDFFSHVLAGVGRVT